MSQRVSRSVTRPSSSVRSGGDLSFGSRVAAFERETLLLLLATCRLYAELAGRGGTTRDLVNFLRGSRALPEGDAERCDEALTGLGVLEAARALWLNEAFERLIEAGLLEPSPESTARWVLTRAGSLVLHERSPLPPGLFPRAPRLGARPGLEERLRRLRSELAAREELSAYVVFPNAVLAQLCATRPRTLTELARIPGLGEVRVRRYGRRILAALRPKKGRLHG